MATIVFCEDDPSIQRLIRASLASTGHEIHLAVDGEEGLALVVSLRPSLVITDLSMPKLDGLAMAERIHATPGLAHTPIIFMSASMSRMRSLDSSSAHPVAVLEKPFSPAELRAAVAENLARRTTEPLAT